MAIGKLYETNTSEVLQRQLKLRNIPEGKKSSFRLVIDNAKRYYSNMDTNILIKILYPVDFKGNSGEYATLFEKIKKAKSSLIISSIQISEFINCCIRLLYKLYMDSTGQKDIDFKKDYRGTEDYRNNMNARLEIVTSNKKLLLFK